MWLCGHGVDGQAEINFAEESGVVQVETFGVSLNAEGTCFYGMQVREFNIILGVTAVETPPPQHRRAAFSVAFELDVVSQAMVCLG